MKKETLEVAEELSTIRKPDDPILKEKIISELFGEFVGFLKGKNLTKGKEFEFQIHEIFQCSKKILWLDEFNEKWQITVYLNSIMMSAQFGVVEKATKTVTYRNKLENLRYNISTGSKLQLTPGSSEKFEAFFKDFVKHFEKLNETI